MNENNVQLHGDREYILRYLLKNPGVSMDIISRDLGINRGTLRYHLDVLLKRGDIISKKLSRKKVFFHIDRHHRATLDNPSPLSTNQHRVLEMIRSDPGISRSELHRSINITSKGLSGILKKLMEWGMIWEVKREGKRLFEPVTEKMILGEMVIDLVEMYLDGKIDKITFLTLKDKLTEDV